MVGSAARIGALFFAVLLVAAGSVWAATINGTSRNDTLRGSPAGDRLYGKAGSDKSSGAGGNDVLVGGAGNDALVGGARRGHASMRPWSRHGHQGQARQGCQRLRGRSRPDSRSRRHRLRPHHLLRLLLPPRALRPTYVFGPEVTSADQAALREALDLGARFIRSSMGRELPPFSVWGYTDLESLIRVYADTAPTRASERTRHLDARDGRRRVIPQGVVRPSLVRGLEPELE